MVGLSCLWHDPCSKEQRIDDYQPLALGESVNSLFNTAVEAEGRLYSQAVFLIPSESNLNKTSRL
jgi:hypothetical protein